MEMNEKPDNDSEGLLQLEKQSAVSYLAQQWAKKYLQNVELNYFYEHKQDALNFKKVVSLEGRKRTAQKLINSLRTVSLQAWNKTEALLSEEIKRHRIDPKLINPWEITADYFGIYEQALHLYIQQQSSHDLPTQIPAVNRENSLSERIQQIQAQSFVSTQMAKIISTSVCLLRQKYTQKDPRVIGFVSMQFHYTNLGLLHTLSPLERTVLGSYLKVIDDHLYMPLQQVYDAAADHDYNSHVLTAVQKLLPISTQIANKICQKIIDLYPNYHSQSGLLSEPLVRVSSIRDVEMFQVYLWVCSLEGSVNAIQQELFPLCAMLYPRLKVQWQLIRCMLHLLQQEICQHLNTQQANTLMPYLQVLWHMFSPKVFGELIL
ncbi:hypothetical protein NIES592_01970 [Fischerella major NIES-592]|uniref:Phycobilisome protein n=1 Tax=Fischerella major NIES-592 TaxID=210994 RepID=A0A1U7H585_9CYAN|nr:hypothetical protein [Fischerella major]OKH16431.1 hypothetical protein NIES592_01970 [Fischerella major NIES-592]